MFWHTRSKNIKAHDPFVVLYRFYPILESRSRKSGAVVLAAKQRHDEKLADGMLEFGRRESATVLTLKQRQHYNGGTTS
jgi:hypothetical protein